MQVAEVIQEPGLYAFYHPNGDLGLGSSRPADAMAQSLRGGEVSGMKMSVRRRHVSHASVHQALLKSVCPGSTSGLTRRFVTSTLLPTDWARPCPGRTQSFYVRRFVFEREYRSDMSVHPRAHDRRSFEKFPRLIAENRDAKKSRRRENRQANPGLSIRGSTHTPDQGAMCMATLPQHGREVLVRLLKCVLVGGILVSAGQAYADDDAVSEIRAARRPS